MIDITFAEEVLRGYRTNICNYKRKFEQIKVWHHQLKMHREGRIEDIDSIIEGLCEPAKVISDMPTTITNEFKSATEDAVIRLRYYLRPSKLEIDAIEDSIKVCARDLYRVVELIDYANRILSKLTDEEDLIICAHYIQGYKMEIVTHIYNLKFPRFEKSVKSINRDKRIALERVAEEAHED